MSTHSLQLAHPPVDESANELLDELGSIVGRLNGAATGNGTAIAEARLRAKTALRAGGSNETARNLAILGFTADAVAALLLEGDVSRALIGSLVDSVAKRLELPVEFVEAGICRGVLRDPRVNELPVQGALHVRLKALYFLLPLSDVSLWMPGRDRELECVAWCGRTDPIQARQEEAGRLLSGGVDRELGRLPVRAVPVLRGGRPVAALVVGTRPGRDLTSLFQEAAASLAPILEKDALLTRNGEREKALVESGERRLARLGFDLHDGAIQEVALLAGDVRLFRHQLEEALEGDARRSLILGRVDDLDARLLALDAELRGLARSYESPTILGRPFGEVLRNEIELFRTRTEIGATLRAEGDFGSLSASQRIALLRIVQEGLANVREHSGATEVHISLACTGGYVHAEIRDNGGGFDVDRTLVGAVTSGRLGLVGMSERTRLLGGMLDVESRPGGPTTIRATLPEWRPLVSERVETDLRSRKEQASPSG